MQKIFYPNFNIDQTLLGGQAFNWTKEGEFYYGVFSDRVLRIKYENDILYWDSSNAVGAGLDPAQKTEENFVKNYFDVNLDYENVLREITKDEKLKKAVEEFKGLRILKQPFEQTLISFVISQNSNIPKIKRSLNLLSQKVGRKIIFDKKEFYLFPTLKELSELNYDELLSTGIGYRAKYLEKISKERCHPELVEGSGSSLLQKIQSDSKNPLMPRLQGTSQILNNSSTSFQNFQDDKKISSVIPAKAGIQNKPKISREGNLIPSHAGNVKRNILIHCRNELLRLHGIGPKVADCILVFGLHFHDITPIDLWARRAFVATYNLDPKIKYEDLLEFFRDKFGENTAYAGQFFFEYFRLNSIK